MLYISRSGEESALKERTQRIQQRVHEGEEEVTETLRAHVGSTQVLWQVDTCAYTDDMQAGSNGLAR